MDENSAVDTMLDSIKISWGKLSDPAITPDDVKMERDSIRRYYEMLRDALGLNDH
jgi:hypothetical protein